MAQFVSPLEPKEKEGETILMALPQETIDETRISVSADSFVEALFGEETIGKQDLA